MSDINQEGKKMKKSTKNTILLFVISLTFSVFAQAPQIINFQGALKDANGQPVNDSKYMEFRIYDVLTGGGTLWTEHHTAVTISGGIFSVELGNITPFQPDMFNYPELYITYLLGGETNEMQPRHRVLSVPYALKSESSISAVIADNSLMIDGTALTGLVQQDSLGNSLINGTMTASAFFGDGSGLTGITGLYDSLYIHSTGSDTMTANSGLPVLVINNSGIGDGISINSSGDDGVYVGNVTTDGIHINSAGDNGIQIESSGNFGVRIDSTGNDGIYIGKAVQNGYRIYESDKDGFHVSYAGTPMGYNFSLENNGLEVAGAEGNGVYVGRSDQNGVFINSAGQSGILVGSANNGVEVSNSVYDGLHIDMAQVDGVHIEEALDNGIQIEKSGNFGVRIDSTGNDGVYIKKAGNPSAWYSSSSKNGIEIAGAEGNGVHVGYSGGSGFRVDDADYFGLYVGNSDYDGAFVYYADSDGYSVRVTGDSSSGYVINGLSNGLEIGSVTGHGVFIGYTDYDGVYVYYAPDNGINIVNADSCGVWANTTNGSGEWGIYTPDKVYGSNVTTRSMSTYGKNTGHSILEQGDIVCLTGYEECVPGDSNVPIIKISKAEEVNSDAIIGVVEYTVKRIEHSADENLEFVGERKLKQNENSDLKSFQYSDGNAYQGDYVSIVTFGPADVKVNSGEDIKTGESLTSQNGLANKVRTTEINGITVAENVGILGKALEDSNGKDKIKVYVNCK